MFNKKEWKFIAGASEPSQIPKIQWQQVAFIGKSNVGKSSLVNALTNRKALARVSKTPGRTRQINFFYNDDKLVITDLPGYGFAKVSHEERRKWNILMQHYLSGKQKPNFVCLLIDARRGIKEHDKEVISLLKEWEIKILLAFTKIDKLTKEEISELLEQTKQEEIFYEKLFLTSSNDKKTLNSLKAYIKEII